MNLSRYVDELQQELLIAAEAGGDDARQLAERLVAPLQAAARLVLLDALSAAAAEITSDLAPGSVELRLRNRDPEFVVTKVTDDVTEPATTSESGATAPPASDGEEGTPARVTLRLPEALKVRIDDAAGQSGLSVNAWLVRTLAAAVDSPGPLASTSSRRPTGGQRFTGWARS